MAISNQLDQSRRPARDRLILRNAKRGAIRAGVGVFVLMLIVTQTIRALHFMGIGLVALSILHRYDVLIDLGIASLAALVGGALAAIQSMLDPSRRTTFSETETHPLD